MQVKCLSLGLGAPKSSQLGLLRAGCDALFLILCQTRKHYKNAGIGSFLCLLGLWSTPPAPWIWGALQPGTFFLKIRKPCKFPIRMALFWDQVAKETATNICENWLRKLLHIWCDEKQQKPHKNAGILRFGPKPATPQIQPAAISPETSSHFSMFELLHENMCFSLHVQGRKHNKNEGEASFCWASGPQQKTSS